MDINLNNVQAEPIVTDVNITAENNKIYHSVATLTFTDPTPSEGLGFTVYVRNGTATIGGTAYAAGSLVIRVYHSGAWSSRVVVSGAYTLPNTDGTANQVLQTNGAGTVTWQTLASGITIGTTAISGGTNNRILFQSGGVVQQSARMTFDGNTYIYDGETATVNSSIFEVKGAGGQRVIRAWQDNTILIGGGSNFFATKGTGSGRATNDFYSTDSHFCFGGVDATKGWVHIGANSNNPSARLDIRAQGALSTDIVQRWRNSANSANLGVILGDGTVNLGLSNHNYTSTVNRVAVVGQNNGQTTYSTSSYLSIFGHDNVVNSYGRTILAGHSNTVNQNSGGINITYGYNNTVAGGASGNFTFGNANNAAGDANILIGYNNQTQYEKTNCTVIGQNLKINGAGNLKMIKLGWGATTTTIAQIDRSFELYLNGTSNSDFHITGKTNVVLSNNTTIVAGTHYEAAATNAVTVHNGIAPTANITNAFVQYSADIVAGNAAPHFRTENGDVVKVYSIGGWGTPTGTLTRTTFDTTTVTLSELAERVAALISDLKTGHGLLKA